MSVQPIKENAPMSKLIIAVGTKHRPRKKELEHLRIYGGDGATHENPSWTVQHHFTSSKHEPEAHDFTDHEQMLDHVKEHTGVE
jgi:hypothetical protein